MALSQFNPFGMSEKEKLDYYIQALREGKSEANLLKPTASKNEFARNAIQGAKTPTGWTALAKTLAAGANNYYATKESNADKRVLKQALAENEAQNQLDELEGAPQGIDPEMMRAGILSDEISPQDLAAMEQTPQQQFEAADALALEQQRGQRTDDLNRARLLALEDKETAVGNHETRINPETEGVIQVAYDQQGAPVDAETGEAVSIDGTVPYDDYISMQRLNKTAAKKPPTSTIISKRGNFRTAGRRAMGLANKIQALNEKGLNIKDLLKDVPRQGVRSALPTVMSSLETEYRDPEVMALLDEIENFSAELLHEKYGGALTIGEQERGARWDPAAMGIDDARTIKRLESIADLAGMQVQEISAPYGEFDWGDPEGLGVQIPTEDEEVLSVEAEGDDGARMARAQQLKANGMSMEQIIAVLDEEFPEL